MRVLLLTPVRPAGAFSGMAMRGQRMVDAFRADDLVVVTVPAADDVAEVRRVRPDGSATVSPLRFPTPDELRRTFTRLLADPRWRARLAAVEPLPRLAERAPVGWADVIADVLDDFEPEAVVVQRSYLAPLGLAIARRWPVPRVLDLDDDDVGVFEQLASPDAAAFHRLIATFAPDFSVLLAASSAEAASLGARFGTAPPAVFPNAVEVPGSVPPLPAWPAPVGDATRSVLLVGNFGYEPNVEGLRWLRDEVVPLLDAALGPWTITAVGRGLAPAVQQLGPGVTLEVAGPVDDLSPRYAAAHVVVVPVLTGGGTRLKVLEAMAHGRPVVSTTLGAGGLGLRDGEQVLLADDAPSFARAIERAAVDRRIAQSLVRAARSAVVEYDAAKVAGGFRRLVAGLVRAAPSSGATSQEEQGR